MVHKIMMVLMKVEKMTMAHKMDVEMDGQMVKEWEILMVSMMGAWKDTMWDERKETLKVWRMETSLCYTRLLLG